jgi:hypothetical protein
MFFKLEKHGDRFSLSGVSLFGAITPKVVPEA